MTNFDRIKECPTPEEMADLLEGHGFLFCPTGKVCLIEQTCHNCITEWLRREVKE